MNFWILNIGVAFILSVYLAGIFIPKILLIAFRKKLFDVPNERKIHTSLVPRLEHHLRPAGRRSGMYPGQYADQ